MVDNKMTEGEYFDKYCKENSIEDHEALYKTHEVKPCDCGDADCDGWKMEKKIETQKIQAKPIFCNKCHKRIIPPAYLLKMNIVVGGKIRLNCGDNRCKGYAHLKN